MPAELLAEVLGLFGYVADDLDLDIPPARVHGGADHLALCLNSRAALAAMHYELDAGRELMNRENLITILFAYAETPRRFHTRNPFASGGVYEDPATGAATAAFAGYLRDLDWAHEGSIEIIQGEDMGIPSRLRAEIPCRGDCPHYDGLIDMVTIAAGFSFANAPAHANPAGAGDSR
jgi:PhzF family phenazine biosynthesis protein